MLDASSIRIYTDHTPIKVVFQSVFDQHILLKELFLWTSRIRSCQVKFMTQLNFDTHCEMNFRFYPFDKQVDQLEKDTKNGQEKMDRKNVGN